MNLDFSKFKKVNDTKTHAVLKHPAGHKIEISKSALSSDHQKLLGKLPMHLDQGGSVQNYYDGGEAQKKDQPTIIINNGQPQQGAQPIQAAQPAPVPQDPDYSTNGQFDDRKFALQNPDVPIQTKIDTMNQLQKETTFNQEQEQKKSENAQKAYNQAVEFNKMAAQQGLPLANVPQPPSNMMPAGQADVPDTKNANMIDIPMSDEMNQRVSPSPLSGQPSMVDTFQKGVTEEMGGLRKEAQALGQQGKAEADIYKQGIQEQQNIQNNYQTKYGALEQKMTGIQNDISNFHIDPNKYVNSMSTGSKIGTIIGLLVGGLGGPENAADKYFDDQINRDIDSQKAELGKKSNLLSNVMQEFGNLNQATTMLKAIHTEILSSKLQVVASQTKDPIAQAKLMQASGQLKQKIPGLLNDIAMKQMLREGLAGASGKGGQPAGSDNTGRLIDMLRISNPELAKNYEGRYVPGVGLAQVQVPEKIREEMVTRQGLQNALVKLSQFAEEHSGSLDPAIMAEGKALAGLTQDQYRRANGQGVFREAEKEFVGSIIGEDPTKFFGNFRTQPRYKAAMEDNESQLNGVKQSYGLPILYKPSSAKKYQGNKNVRVAEKGR